jgi:hypothetical protein
MAMYKLNDPLVVMQAVMTPDVAKAFAKEVPHITASQSLIGN